MVNKHDGLQKKHEANENVKWKHVDKESQIELYVVQRRNNGKNEEKQQAG